MFGSILSMQADALFLRVSLLLGVVFAVLVPPFQSPDEPNHFFRAYQVSEGVFFPEIREQRLGGTLPRSLAQVRDSFSSLKMNYNARTNPRLIWESLSIPLNAQQRDFLDFPNTAIYAPTAYLPQSTAIALSRMAGASPLQMLYAARLSNLLLWILLVWTAIRAMPFLKSTMLVLALLPASIVVAASANADVTTNGMSWCLVAWLVRGVRFPAALAATVVICANKLIAWPLVLLYWFRSWGKRVLAGLSIAAIGLAAALLWGNLAQQWFIPYDAYHPGFRDAQTLNEGVSPVRQKAYIAEHPLHFISVAAKSFALSVPSTAAHFVGKFGWEKNYLHPVWIVLLWLSIILVCASEQNPLRPVQRLGAVGIAGLYVALFALTMYVLWCPVGAAEVSNFQGRYFVPIAPVVALAVAYARLGESRTIIFGSVLGILLASHVAMAIEIWWRYYQVAL
ncbi:MAG: DUF2142 domain-containing protein [Saprospiraceae bacterium]|nr:DUF2142 domain-containing protein [Saprospiraceae bacterium]